MKLFTDIRDYGLAATSDLLWLRHEPEIIRLWARGGKIIQVRKGWYCMADEHPEVIRAWRVGGRLACVSAVAFHLGLDAPGALHVEVPANSARLRHPDDRWRRLSEGDEVVIHWARTLSAGDSRAVDWGDAQRQAARCQG